MTFEEFQAMLALPNVDDDELTSTERLRREVKTSKASIDAYVARQEVLRQNLKS